VKVAALYDIHGNLPALDAVLEDVQREQVDRIVVGGDVLPGPMPRETLVRLLSLDTPVDFIYGNGELAALAQFTAADPAQVTYWGTTRGEPLPPPLAEVVRWSAYQVFPEYQAAIAGWPRTLSLRFPELGEVLFCHGTPRSEVECFTRLTPAAALLPVFDGISASLVVCGHTHMQFDRVIGKTRVVNAGSVGMPFAEPGAYWLLLGPDVRLRRSSYDLSAAAERIRTTGYPQANEVADTNILNPPRERMLIDVLTSVSFR